MFNWALRLLQSSELGGQLISPLTKLFPLLQWCSGAQSFAQRNNSPFKWLQTLFAGDKSQSDSAISTASSSSFSGSSVGTPAASPSKASPLAASHTLSPGPVGPKSNEGQVLLKPSVSDLETSKKMEDLYVRLTSSYNETSREFCQVLQIPNITAL